MVNTKQFRIITRKGTKIKYDKVKSNSTVLQNHEHPNKKVQKQTFNRVTQVFKDISIQEDRLDYKSTKFN